MAVASIEPVGHLGRAELEAQLAVGRAQPVQVEAALVGRDGEPTLDDPLVFTFLQGHQGPFAHLQVSKKPTIGREVEPWRFLAATELDFGQALEEMGHARSLLDEWGRV